MGFRQRVSLAAWVAPGWCVASALMVVFIWANSLVPGAGSSAVSHAAVSSVRGLLGSLGIAAAWVTNLLVRKAAHLIEYAILGFLVMGAFGPALARDRRWLAVAVLVLVLVPAIDETIQICTPGRSGQLADVLIDCTGALAGSLVRSGATALRARSRRRGEKI